MALGSSKPPPKSFMHPLKDKSEFIRNLLKQGISKKLQKHSLIPSNDPKLLSNKSLLSVKNDNGSSKSNEEDEDKDTNEYFTKN